MKKTSFIFLVKTTARRVFGCLLCSLFLSSFLQAQSIYRSQAEEFVQVYQKAVGLRLGYPTSINYKRFLSNNKAVEFGVGARGSSSWNMLSLSISLQQHFGTRSLLEAFDLPEVENFSWYVGGGVSGYVWTYNNGYNPSQYSRTSWGLQVMLGAEYKFEDFPLILVIDWAPRWFLGGGWYRGLGVGYGTLGIRYPLGES
ncbi:MAG: hypothetical protein AAFR61_24775 [Bacteroidota bacterium]